MKRHSLVSFLLPAKYREQVLGDLQERGFRLTELAAVLPHIWWSYLRRVWTIPRYALAGAQDETLQLRVRQFQRCRFWWAVVWYVAAYRPSVFPAPYSSIFAVLMLLLIWDARNTSVRRLAKLEGADRSKWIEFHRKQLTAGRYRGWAGYPFVLVPLTMTLVAITWDLNISGTLLMLMFAACPILGQFRASRLKRELAGLE